MDINLIRRYIKYFNDIRTNNKSSKILTMMIYDSFSGYLKELIKKGFSNNSIDLVVIPNRLTNIYQLFNIAINKLFKDNFHKEWHL